MDFPEGALDGRQAVGTRHWTVQQYLIGLVVFCLLPGIFGIGLVCYQEYREGGERLERDTLLTARALVQAVDADLLRVPSAARTLSADDSLARRDFRRFDQRARDASSLTNPGVNVVPADTNNRQLVDTLREFGEPLSRNGSSEAIEQALSSGKATYILNISIAPEQFAAVLDSLGLPAGSVAAILDPRGTIVARTHAAGQVMGQENIEAFIRQLWETPDKAVAMLTREGTETLVAVSRSPNTGWSVGIGIPAQEGGAGRQRLHWLAIGVIALFGICGGLAWWIFGRRIAESVRRLTILAMDQGEKTQAMSALDAERRNAEEKLREAAARLEAVCKSGVVLLADYDADLRLTSIHYPAKDFEPEMLLGKVETQIADNFEEAQANMALKRRVMASGIGDRREVKMTWGGQAYWFDQILEPKYDALGRIVGVTCAAIDITGRKAAEAALMAQERTLRSFFGGLPFMMGWVEVEGNDIRHIADNGTSAGFFGRAGDEIKGRLASELDVPPQYIRYWVEKCGASREQKQPVSFLCPPDPPSAHRCFSVTVNYVGMGDKGFHRYSYVLEDVSCQREAEARAARLNRMYVALGKTNQVVAFRYERTQMLNEACAIATTCTGFSAASIALIDPETGVAELVAYSGSEAGRQALEDAHAQCPQLPDGCSKWRTVMRGEPYVCNDWRLRKNAGVCLEMSLLGQLRSSAVFPLLVEGSVVAAFSVYSDEADAFDRQLLDVLKEMAAVVSFGLESLEREQKRVGAEEALRRSEEKLRRLLDTSQEGVWMIDGNARTTYMNQSMADLLCLRPEEAAGIRLHDFMDKESAEQARELFRQGAVPASSLRDVCFERGDGSRFWAILAVSPIMDDTGAGVGGALLMVTDISARKRAEAALKESEARFRAITEAAADAVIVMGADGAISFWNPAAERIFGFTGEEAVGRNVHELLALPGERQRAGAGMEMFRRDGSGPVMATIRETFALRKDGQVLPIEISVSGARTKDGWNAVGIIRDITVRKQAEAALRDSQNMLSRVMNLVPHIIYLYDCESRRTLYVNRAVEKVTGYTPDEVEAMDAHLIQKLVHPDDSPRLLQASDRWLTAEEGESIESECRIATVNGMWRHMSLHETVIARVDTGKPLQILGVAEDVTVQVWQQRLREEKQADLMRMGRLVTMGEMASALAHELNQPLTAITNFTQACLNIIARKPDNLGELAEGLEKTAAQALRAGTVLQTVRDFVRKREANPGALQINDVIAEAVGLARIRSRTGVAQYSLVLGQDLPLVWADRILIDQVLMNLLRNAEEAMAGTADPLIEIATDHGEEGFVMVSVYDVGPGLPAGFDLDRLPSFFTTKADGMGVGLGICRGIIEASGGRIWAEMLPERGTVFRFTLPTASSRQAPFKNCDSDHGNVTSGIYAGSVNSHDALF